MQRNLGLLGEIEFRDHERQIAPLVRPNQRRLLAILGCNYREPVSSEWLADVLDLSPGGLRTRIRRVRQIIGDDGIVTQGSGYRLGDVTIDAETFTMTRQAGIEARGSEQIQTLEAALALWRGPALSEFGHEAWAAGEAARLNELRSAAADDLVAAYLAFGQRADAIALAESEVTRHPFRDRSRRLLMQSLASAGRDTEALRAYNDYRTFLIEETGTEPPTVTRELEQQIAMGAFEMPDNAPERPTGDAANRDAGSPSIATIVATFVDTESLAAAHVTGLRDTEPEILSGARVLEASDSGVVVAFEDPIRAMTFAEQLQTNPELPLSISIHAGLVHGDSVADSSTTDALNRLLHAANPGQTLLSSAAATLAGRSHGFSLRGRGIHRMHDGEKMEVVELVIGTGSDGGGRLRTTTDSPTNISAMRPPLIGRSADLETLAAHLATHRLVSVIGPAGVGKSAVALEAAFRRLALQRDGVFVAELAPIDDPTRLPGTIAKALELRSKSVADGPALAEALRDRHVLIVLDNAEHLIDAVADIADAILAVEGPSLLVTSREWLDVAGEKTLPLSRLSAMSSSGRSFGAELFRENARNAGVEIAAFDDAVVETLAERLDHLPLALELAAGAAIHLTPEQLIGSLERGDRLHETRRRNRVRRFTSLDEMLMGSFELLSAAEQSLLLTMSVFRGLTSLEAIEGIWDHSDSHSLPTLLGNLVLRSLVATQNVSGEVMYFLLETIRDFTIDHGQTGDARTAVQRAHRDWFLAWSTPSSLREQYGSTSRARDFEAQLDNLREAMSFSETSGELRELHEQASHLASLWFTFLHGDEGMEWFRRSRSDALGATELLHHLVGRISASFASGRPNDMSDLVQELTVQCENSADAPASALGAALVAITRTEDLNASFGWLAEAERIDSDTGADVRPILDHLAGDLFLATQQFEHAEARYRSAIEGLDGTEYAWWVSADLVGWSLCRLAAGDPVSGVSLVTDSLRIARSLPDSLGGITRGVVVQSALLSTMGSRSDAKAGLATELERAGRRSDVAAVRAEPIVGVLQMALDDEDWEMAGLLWSVSQELDLAQRSPWQRFLLQRAAAHTRSMVLPPASASLEAALSACHSYVRS